MSLVQSLESDLEKIIELRQEVLHPGGPRDRVVYAQDKEDSTIHLIHKDLNGDILITGTMILEAEEENGEQEFRIRGMAVSEKLRGQGLGTKLLEKFIEVAREEKVYKIWCNARVKALPLYERKGFVKTGEPFDVPGSGPHYRMRLKIGGVNENT
ncbi:MAG: GNAT family N-acetyltransferase [Bdellovibrionales bacterium]